MKRAKLKNKLGRIGINLKKILVLILIPRNENITTLLACLQKAVTNVINF